MCRLYQSTAPAVVSERIFIEDANHSPGSQLTCVFIYSQHRFFSLIHPHTCLFIPLSMIIPLHVLAVLPQFGWKCLLIFLWIAACSGIISFHIISHADILRRPTCIYAATCLWIEWYWRSMILGLCTNITFGFAFALQPQKMNISNHLVFLKSI